MREEPNPAHRQTVAVPCENPSAVTRAFRGASFAYTPLRQAM